MVDVKPGLRVVIREVDTDTRVAAVVASGLDLPVVPLRPTGSHPEELLDLTILELLEHIHVGLPLCAHHLRRGARRGVVTLALLILLRLRQQTRLVSLGPLLSALLIGWMHPRDPTGTGGAHLQQPSGSERASIRSGDLCERTHRRRLHIHELLKPT